MSLGPSHWVAGAIPVHLGDLHPHEAWLVLLIAFGPFVVIALLVQRERRRERDAPPPPPSPETDS